MNEAISIMDMNLLSRLSKAAQERTAGNGPAHDFLHVSRVTDLARRIGLAEGADLAIVIPAALLHEVFNHPKNHPESHLSGEVCAREAAQLLRQEECPEHLIGAICDCIRTHSFSRGLVPGTIEGKVLQDADRLDAIGAIGIARCFATLGEMRLPLYNGDDPFCRLREPDDKAWGLDHFYRKLLRIPEGLHTPAARAIAADRFGCMKQYLAQLESELTFAD
jgi:uncharacterized protein